MAKLIPEAPKLRQRFFFPGKIKYEVEGTENKELEKNRGFMTLFIIMLPHCFETRPDGLIRDLVNLKLESS